LKLANEDAIAAKMDEIAACVAISPLYIKN
jgi:hypothetical protein